MQDDGRSKNRRDWLVSKKRHHDTAKLSQSEARETQREERRTLRNTRVTRELAVAQPARSTCEISSPDFSQPFHDPIATSTCQAVLPRCRSLIFFLITIEVYHLALLFMLPADTKANVSRARLAAQRSPPRKKLECWRGVVC